MGNMIIPGSVTKLTVELISSIFLINLPAIKAIFMPCLFLTSNHIIVVLFNKTEELNRRFLSTAETFILIMSYFAYTFSVTTKRRQIKSLVKLLPHFKNLHAVLSDSG